LKKFQVVSSPSKYNPNEDREMEGRMAFLESNFILDSNHLPPNISKLRPWNLEKIQREIQLLIDPSRVFIQQSEKYQQIEMAM